MARVSWNYPLNEGPTVDSGPELISGAPTLVGGLASWDGSALHLEGTNSSGTFEGTTVADGGDYHVTFDYNTSAANTYIRLGGGGNVAVIPGPAVGTFDNVLNAQGTGYVLNIASDNNSGDFTNFSVKSATGGDIIHNTDPSTQGNYQNLPIFDTDALAQDGIRTVDIPAFDFVIGGDIKLDVIYSDGTFLDGSSPVLTGVAGVITAGVNVSNITVNGSAYAGETIADGTHLTIGCDISTGTVTTIGPIATGAITNLIMESSDSIGYKLDEGVGTTAVAYDIVNGEFGAPKGFGPELVTNGTFNNNNISGWLANTSSPSIVLVGEDDALLGTSDTGTLLCFMTVVNLEAGTTYEITYDVIEADVISQVRVGYTDNLNIASAPTQINTSGTVSIGTNNTTFVAGLNSTYLTFGGRNDVDLLKVDNITLKRVYDGTITPDADWEYIPEYTNNGAWTPDTDWTFIDSNTRYYPMNEGSGDTFHEAYSNPMPTYKSPNLVSNGKFTTSDDWVISGGWTIDTVLKVARFAGATDESMIQTFTTTPGKTYQVDFDIEIMVNQPVMAASGFATPVSGPVTVAAGNNEVILVEETITTKISRTIHAETVSTDFGFAGNGGTEFTITNVEVREIVPGSLDATIINYTDNWLESVP